MKVERTGKEKPTDVTFGQLPIGAAFTWANKSPNDLLCMKLGFGSFIIPEYGEDMVIAHCGEFTLVIPQPQAKIVW